MTDPTPGENTGSRPTPSTPPVDPAGDGQFRHEGYWNSFQFDPPLTHEDALLLSARAEDLGYRLLLRRADYSLEEVQARLVEKGPSAFLNLTQLQEDISPKEPPATAEQRMAERLRHLAPERELIITDPYLFTGSRKNDSDAYAASVATMMAPTLRTGLHITAIVDPAQNNETVRTTVKEALHQREPDLTISVLESRDFHDRFWIADRARGLIIGTSFNKIGTRIFFVDQLSDHDLAAVLEEVEQIRPRHPEDEEPILSDQELTEMETEMFGAIRAANADLHRPSHDQES